MLGELELGALAPRVVGRITEVVDAVVGELQIAQLEELFPADALGPFAQALVLAGFLGVHFDDLLDHLGQRRPAGRLVGDKGHDDLGELRHGDAVGHLAADHEHDAVALAGSERHGRAHGVAVAAVHAARGVDRNGVDLLAVDFNLGRLDGAGGAGGNGQGHFADVVQAVVLDDGGLAVDADDADVGAVHRAAHVEAAGQRDADHGRQGHGLEVLEHLVHDGFDRAGGVGGRGVAVGVTLGVDDVGDAGAGAADRELLAAASELAGSQIGQQAVKGGFGLDHELHVVTRGEAQVAAAVLLGDLADLADVRDAHEAGSADAHGVDHVAGQADMLEHAGFDDLVVVPLTFVFLDDRRIELLEMTRTNIRDPVFHGLVGIVSGRDECHFLCPPLISCVSGDRPFRHGQSRRAPLLP